MITCDEKLNIIEKLNTLYADDSIRDRTFYPEFRTSWNSVLKNSVYLDDYPCSGENSVFTVDTTFCGIDFSFNFDQLKIAEWFSNEQKRNSRAIFYPKRLKRDLSGRITYHDAQCHYNAKAEEPSLSDEKRNIIACAIPDIIPKLNVVYGNKWVNEKFSAFRQRTISMFLIETDFTPSFLMSPFEVCVYLFMMDYCIIKSDYSKVKDDDLKNFLHIFRPSPMLKIKGLI